MECSEGCTISFHPTCWRRNKTDSEQKTDREFLLTVCPTPDCVGIIKMLVVYDNKGGIKAKVRESLGLDCVSQLTCADDM